MLCACETAYPYRCTLNSLLLYNKITNIKLNVLHKNVKILQHVAACSIRLVLKVEKLVESCRVNSLLYIFAAILNASAVLFFLNTTFSTIPRKIL